MKKTIFGLAIALGFGLFALLGAKPAAAQVITGPYSTNYGLDTSYLYNGFEDFMIPSYFPLGYGNNFYRSTDYNNYHRSVLDRNVSVRMVSPDGILARNVVLLNRDLPTLSLTLRNQVTGPFSVNRLEVTVDDASFWRLVNTVSATSNVNVTVDTGRNTVSFNTVAGNVTTGNVNISL